MPANPVTLFGFHARYIAIATTFLFYLYCTVFMWIFVPFTDFGLNWRPDSRLNVYSVPDTSLAATLLEVGDEILAVDNKPVTKGSLVFSLPVKDTYSLTIQRGADVLVLDVPFIQYPGPLAISYRLPAGILAFSIWLVGAIALYVAKKENVQAIQMGYIFVIQGTSIIGLQATLISVPFTWFTGVPLMFVVAAGWVYLGFLPRYENPSKWVERCLSGIFILSLFLLLVALVEGIILLPQRTSFQEITSVSLYGTGFLATALSFVIQPIILLVRRIKMKPSQERQQVSILIFLVGLAVVPVSLLTFIPRSLLNTVFLPFPIAMVLLLLVPLAFFYVIYRQGYLGLDLIFSQSVTLLITLLLTIGFFGLGFYFLQLTFTKSNLITSATLLSVPAVFVALYSKPRITNRVDKLIYGDIDEGQIFSTVAADLSAKPENETLENIIEHLSTEFELLDAMLLLKGESDLEIVAKIGYSEWWPTDLFNINNSQVRSSGNYTSAAFDLFERHPWLEVIIPVKIREQVTGFLLLGQPYQSGFFNAKHISLLSRLADVIAVGSEAITLFEASRKLSQDLMRVHEVERTNLAMLLHDSSLQTLTYITQQLANVTRTDNLSHDELHGQLGQLTDKLHDVSQELRDLSVNLRPPIIDQGLILTIEDVAHRFKVDHGLQIQIDNRLTPDFDSSDDVVTTSYHIITEAMNNVVKHAQTTDVHINLFKKNHCFVIVVSDNGVGLRLQDQSVTDLYRQGHLGVMGMTERAAAIGGTLHLESNDPSGTQVILEIPLSAKQEVLNGA